MTIHQTNNFTNSLTWVTRLIQFLIGMTVLYLVDLQEMQNGLFIGCVFGSLLTFLLIAFPVDEIKLDGNNLYFLKKSIVPIFNRVTIYDISGMRGIGSFSISGVAGLSGLFIPIMNAHRVEFIFKDNSSESRELLVRKSDLKKILTGVREIIRQNSV